MDRWKGGWNDGQTDETYFIGASWPRSWVQKVKRQYGNLNKKNTLWVSVLILVKQKLFSFCNEERNITYKISSLKKTLKDGKCIFHPYTNFQIFPSFQISHFFINHCLTIFPLLSWIKLLSIFS